MRPKYAPKSFIRLSPRVNFANILWPQSRQFLCTNTSLTFSASTKKLLEKLSYEKAACKMLVKLTPGVNFTNVLRADFTYVSWACIFLCLCFRFVLYWCKTVGAKAVRRMLVKFTPGGKKKPLQASTLPQSKHPRDGEV
jgi:hypothetical protein